MSDTKLLPCPFCGAAPEETGNNLIGIVIACRTPNCLPEPLVATRNRAEAYPAWNKRAPVQHLVGETETVAALKEANAWLSRGDGLSPAKRGATRDTLNEVVEMIEAALAKAVQP